MACASNCFWVKWACPACLGPARQLAAQVAAPAGVVLEGLLLEAHELQAVVELQAVLPPRGGAPACAGRHARRSVMALLIVAWLVWYTYMYVRAYVYIYIYIYYICAIYGAVGRLAGNVVSSHDTSAAACAAQHNSRRITSIAGRNCSEHAASM